MDHIKGEYAERINEAKLYYDFILGIHIIAEKNTKTPCGLNLDSQTLKILKANLLLMLYNVVEFAFTRMLEYINDVIASDKDCCYTKLNENLRIYWHETFLRNDPSNNFKTYQEQLRRAITAVIDEEAINLNSWKQSGNWGAKEATFICDSYAIPITKDRTIGVLENIKTHRQVLAHGQDSFARVGADLSLLELRNYIDDTDKVLADLFQRSKDYVEHKKYKTA